MKLSTRRPLLAGISLLVLSLLALLTALPRPVAAELTGNQEEEPRGHQHEEEPGESWTDPADENPQRKNPQTKNPRQGNPENEETGDTEARDTEARDTEAGDTEAGDTEEKEAQKPASPMDLFIVFSRTQLSMNGFVRHQGTFAGRTLTWWEKGEPMEGEPAIVFIHGVSDQAGTWFRVAPALAQEHHVLLVDLPGHGESEPAEGPLPMTTVMEGFDAWLAAEAVREGHPPPVLIGNSMGAWVALLASLHHPERVGRIVAVNGGGLHSDTGDLTLLPKTREEARKVMEALRDPSNPATPDVVLDDLVRRGPTSQTARMFEANDDLESHVLDDRLGEIQAPVDLLWGESDRYLGTGYARRLLEGLPRARLTVVPKCGHLPQAECPERFAPMLGEILTLAPPPAETTRQPTETPTVKATERGESP